MAKGSSQPQQTSTSTLQMSPEQQALFNLALPGVKSFAASVPQRYPGSTVAGFDPAQLQGQQMALDTAGGAQQQIANTAADTSNFYLGGDIWNPSSNPNLRGAIDAAVRPITENYQQVVRPAIRDDFAGNQPFGGSRRAIAENFAGNQYLRNVGDTSAKLVQNVYDTNIAAQLRALGLAPTTQQTVTQPALTTSGVGDVRQNLAQQILNADVSGFNYDQLAPFLQSKEILSLLTGIPGGTTTSVSTANTPQKNPYTSALGGAASGAALGSMIFPGVGTAAGAGLGALLSFL